MSQPFPGSPGQSSHCSGALVQAVSLISVPPCGLWLLTPFLSSCPSSLKPSHILSIPSLFIKPPCSKPLAEAGPVSCQHVRSQALPPALMVTNPTVTLQVHFSCSLYAQSAAPSTAFQPQLPDSGSLCASGCQSQCVSPALSCSVLVPVFVLSTFTSYGFLLLLAVDSASHTGLKPNSPCLSGLVPAFPCSPCLLSTLPSA